MSLDVGADLVAGLVERAALDGSTCLPAPVLAAALRGQGIEAPGPSAEAAYEAGRVAAYLDERLFGHPTWAPLEEQVAESVVELITRGGPNAVRVVVAPRGSAAPPAPEGAVVVDAAHRLGLADAADLLARLADTGTDARLVLVGDPAMPYAPGPGRVLADLVDSGVLPVEQASPQDEGQLSTLVRALRAGELPALDPAQRDVVITPAADAEQALRRSVQLVTSSVPRVFGVRAADTLVLAPRQDGRVGAACAACRTGRGGRHGRPGDDRRRGTAGGRRGRGPRAGRGVGRLAAPGDARRRRHRSRTAPVGRAPGRAGAGRGGGASPAPTATDSARRTAAAGTRLRPAGTPHCETVR